LKILIIGPNPDVPVIGGVVTHVANVARYYKKTGSNDVSILDTTFHKDGKKKTILQSLWTILSKKYSKYHLIYVNTSIYFSSLVKLGYLLRRINMDCTAGKVIVQFHGGTLQNITGLKKFILKRLLSQKTLSTGTCYMFLTGEQKREFGKWFPYTEKKLMLSTHLVQVEAEYPKKDFSQIKVLFLSRIEKEKGIYEVIEAAQKLEEKPDIHFYIAGQGSEAEAVERKVKNSKNITYVGAVMGDLKEELIKECNVFCLLSSAEGLPYALLENMAWGNIPIVTDTGRMKEFAAKNESGFIVSKDSNELCGALEQLMNDRGLAAQKSYNAYLTIKKMQDGEQSDKCFRVLQN